MRFLLSIFLLTPLPLSAQTVLVWLSGQGVVRLAHAGPAVQAVLAWEGEAGAAMHSAPFDLLPGEQGLPANALFSGGVGQGIGCWALYEAPTRRELSRTCTGGARAPARSPAAVQVQVSALLVQRGAPPLAQMRSPLQGSDGVCGFIAPGRMRNYLYLYAARHLV